MILITKTSDQTRMYVWSSVIAEYGTIPIPVQYVCIYVCVCVCMYVCVCVFFSSHSFWTSSSLDVPAGVTQEEGHTGFLIHLPSAVRALIFLARRI